MNDILAWAVQRPAWKQLSIPYQLNFDFVSHCFHTTMASKMHCPPPTILAEGWSWGNNLSCPRGPAEVLILVRSEILELLWSHHLNQLQSRQAGRKKMFLKYNFNLKTIKLTTSLTSFCMLLWMPMIKGVGVERISRSDAGRRGTYVCEYFSGYMRAVNARQLSLSLE